MDELAHKMHHLGLIRKLLTAKLRHRATKKILMVQFLPHFNLWFLFKSLLNLRQLLSPAFWWYVHGTCFRKQVYSHSHLQYEEPRHLMDKACGNTQQIQRCLLIASSVLSWMCGMSMLEGRDIAGWSTDVLKTFLSVSNHNFPCLNLWVLNPLAVHLQEEFGSIFGSVA